jgi:hypothetical protein
MQLEFFRRGVIGKVHNAVSINIPVNVGSGTCHQEEQEIKS